MGILINGIVDVLLTNLMVCCSICVIDIIELGADGKDQEHLTKPGYAGQRWLFVHEGQLGSRFLSATDIEDGVLMVQKHAEEMERYVL